MSERRPACPASRLSGEGSGPARPVEILVCASHTQPGLVCPRICEFLCSFPAAFVSAHGAWLCAEAPETEMGVTVPLPLGRSLARYGDTQTGGPPHGRVLRGAGMRELRSGGLSGAVVVREDCREGLTAEPAFGGLGRLLCLEQSPMPVGCGAVGKPSLATAEAGPAATPGCGRSLTVPHSPPRLPLAFLGLYRQGPGGQGGARCHAA